MDSKIRIKTNRIRLIMLILIPLSLFLTPSCKQNKWAEWKVQNEMWLEQIAQKEGVRKSASGLLYEIEEDPLKDNGEARPNLTSTVICDYRVELINGYVIEYQGPTFGGSQSATLNLANTISGFAEGCTKIHNHGDIKLYIPAYLGYDQAKYNSNEYGDAEGFGTEGTTAYIPPYSTLIYTIHLCSVISD